MSLQDGINTAMPTGRFTFNIFASLAEFEREISRERTKAGLGSAKARGKGRQTHRPVKGSHGEGQVSQDTYDTGTKAVEEIARILGIGRATCYRYIQSPGEAV